MPTHIQCPRCATGYEVTENSVARLIVCSHCGESFFAEPPAAATDPQPIAEQLPVAVPLPDESSPQAVPPRGYSSCKTCGKLAPTAQVTFHQHIGAVVLMFHKSISGNLCRECVDKYFREFSLVTLFLGWWGFISFFVTPFSLVMNLIRYSSARYVRSVAAAPAIIDQDGVEVAQGDRRSVARSKLMIPAIGLIVTASIGLLSDGLASAVNFYETNNPAATRTSANASDGSPGSAERLKKLQESEKTGQLIMAFVWAGKGLISLLILLAAVQMLRVKMYPFAMAGSILGSIPLLAPCCVLTVPFGIWGIVVLCRADVRRGFA